MKPKWRWTTPDEFERARIQQTQDEWAQYYARMRMPWLAPKPKIQKSPRSAWAAAKERARAQRKETA